MEKRTRDVIIVILIVFSFAVGAYFGYNIKFTPPDFTDRPDWPDLPDDGDSDKIKDYLERDRKAYLTLKTAMATVNLVVAFTLLVLYVDTYRHVKSRFTIGLIMVMLSFLAYALATNPMLHESMGFRTLGLGPFTMIPDLFMMVALCTLLYLSED